VDTKALMEGVAGSVAFDVPAAPFTSYHLGGPVAAWVEPRDVEDLCHLLGRLKGTGVRVLPLGGGSNVLFADAGFDGVVLRLGRSFQGVEVQGTRLRVKAATPLQVFLRRATEAGLGPFEFCAGIPGQVGGAVVGNAGGGKAWIGERVESVTVVGADGSTREIPAERLEFESRHSSLQDSLAMVVEATFRGDRMPHSELEKRNNDYLKARQAKQPHAERSAGSVFRNPEGDAAGRVIEFVGLQGLKVGGARVSDRHANFIVSDSGTASDVAEVMREVQRRVRESVGVRLKPEILPVGDWDWSKVGEIWWHREGPHVFRA